MLKVDTGCMEAQAQQMQRIANELNEISSRVAGVSRKLCWNTSIEAVVRSRLVSYSSSVSSLDNKASQLARALNSAITQYEQAENNAKSVNSATDSTKPSESSSDKQHDISIVEWMKSILKWMDKTDENGIEGFAEKVLGYFESLYKLFTGESVGFAGAQAWLDLCDHSVDLWKEFYDTLREYYNGTGGDIFSESNQAKVKGLGVVGSILGLAGALFGSADTINNSDNMGIAGKIGQYFEASDEAVDVGKAIAEMLQSGAEKQGGVYTPLSFYTAIAEGYLAAFGQGFTSYEQYAADGWDLGDTANTGVEISVAGLYSMISALSFDLISEKTTGVSDEEISSFLENTVGDLGTRAGNYINEDPGLRESYQDSNVVGKALITFYAAIRSL